MPCMTPGDKAMDVQGQILSDSAVVEQHSCTFNELAVDMIQTMECDVECTELVSILVYKLGANFMGLDHAAKANSMGLDKQLGLNDAGTSDIVHSQPLSAQILVPSWKRRARLNAKPVNMEKPKVMIKAKGKRELQKCVKSSEFTPEPPIAKLRKLTQDADEVSLIPVVPTPMKLLSLNCRGLGNPETVQELHDLVKQEAPQVMFLMETWLKVGSMERIRVKLGFAGSLAVNRVRFGGGLALM